WLLIQGLNPRAPDHETATAHGQRAFGAAGSKASIAPMASSDPITAAFRAYRPARPASSGAACRRLGWATASRSAASRAPPTTLGAVTPKRCRKAAGGDA